MPPALHRSAAGHNLPAGDHGPGIAAGLGGKIVPAGVDNDGAADDLLHPEAVGQKRGKGVALTSQQRGQFPRMGRVGTLPALKMAAGMGKGPLRGAGTGLALVDVQPKEILRALPSPTGRPCTSTVTSTPLRHWRKVASPLTPAQAPAPRMTARARAGVLFII